MPLLVAAEPFDHPAFVYELKYDGYRALAHHDGATRLVSRKGHIYRQFDSVSADLQHVLQGHTATLDGELVCLDSSGRPKFWDLLRHRGEPHYAAFDILELDSRDLTQLPLIQRKAVLRRLIPKSGPVLYVSHVDSGVALFDRVCAMDLEGIVAKARDGWYDPERTSWVKILNEKYSQRAGRAELFRKRR